MIKEDLVSTFGTCDLYEILELEKTCTGTQIKKAYHKKSLKLHPDRQQDDKENFTQRFQLLHQIYSLLSDSHKREEYDKHGTLQQDDFVSNKTSTEWADYWRELFKKVTVEDVTEFEGKYKGSEEEQQDVKKYYNSSKGDMDVIMSSIMTVMYDEEDRIRGIIEEMIAKKEVKKYKAYTQEEPKRRKKRMRDGKKEEKEAAQAKDEMADSEDALRQTISLRQEERGKKMDSFFAQLEAKYAPPAKKRKKK